MKNKLLVGLGILLVFVTVACAFCTDVKYLEKSGVLYFNGDTMTTDIPLEQVIQTPFEEVELEEGDFIVVVLPDTQNYVEKYQYVFNTQIRFIIENKDKIAAVVHVGDLVNRECSEMEWETLSKSFEPLDETDIPYAVLPGNHDMPDIINRLTGRLFIDVFISYPDKNDNYNKYFGPGRFNKSWYAGRSHQELNNNNMVFFDAGGMEFMILSIEYCPDDRAIDWAQNMLKFYPEKRVIFSTHCYMDENAERADCGKIGGMGGQEIWNNFIRNHDDQIFLVVSGHEGDSSFEGCGSYRADQGISYGWVHQFFSNYQHIERGGNGWLKLFIFKPDKDEILVKTYSPFLNEYADELEKTIIYDMGIVWGEHITASAHNLEEEQSVMFTPSQEISIENKWLYFSGFGVYYIFLDEYLQMREEGLDKYHHCMANCRASKIGKFTEASSLNVIRELHDEIKSWVCREREGWCEEDVKANKWGLYTPEGVDCQERCSIYGKGRK